MGYYKKIYIFLSLLFLFSCGDKNNQHLSPLQNEENNSNDPTIIKPVTQKKQISQTLPRPFTILNYKISAYLNDDYSLSIKNTVTLRIIQFTKNIVLDFKNPNIVSIKNIEGQSLNYSYEKSDGRLTIDVPQGLNSGDKFQFQINYNLTNQNNKIYKIFNIKNSVGYITPKTNQFLYWIPAINTPYETASLNFKINLPENLFFVTQGKIINNQIITINKKQKRRVIEYSSEDIGIPLQNILFAYGELTLTQEEIGGTTFNFYYRKDLKINTKEITNRIAYIKNLLESKIGKFPIQNLNLIFVPENIESLGSSGLALLSEDYGTDVSSPIDRINLSKMIIRQFFGSKLLFSEWNDIWILEGLCTLFSYYANYFEKTTASTLGLDYFGLFYSFNPSETVIDNGLEAEDKLTTGVLSRSAWILNQIKFQIGEYEFNKTLRSLLLQEGFYQTTTTEFLNTLLINVNDKTKTLVFNSLLNNLIPKITLEKTGLGTKINIENANSLITPIYIQFSINGEKQVRRLTHKTFYLPKEARSIVFDPYSTHPHWKFFIQDESSQKIFKELLSKKTYQDITQIDELTLASRFDFFSSPTVWHLMLQNLSNQDNFTIFNPYNFLDQSKSLLNSLLSNNTKWLALDKLCLTARHHTETLEKQNINTISFKKRWLNLLQKTIYDINTVASPLAEAINESKPLLNECNFWNPEIILEPTLEKIKSLNINQSPVNLKEYTTLTYFNLPKQTKINIIQFGLLVFQTNRIKLTALNEIQKLNLEKLSKEEIQALLDSLESMIKVDQTPEVEINLAKTVALFSNAKFYRYIQNYIEKYERSLNQSDLEKLNCYKNLIKTENNDIHQCE
jgi:hypothetical protein